MIHILHDMQWSPEWNVTKNNRYVVDLRDCTDEASIVGRIGVAVKDPDYPGYAESLNTLYESLLDWYGRYWGRKVELYLRGAETMKRARPDLMDDLVSDMTRAFERVAEYPPECSCDRATAWERIKIVFCHS